VALRRRLSPGLPLWGGTSLLATQIGAGPACVKQLIEAGFRESGAADSGMPRWPEPAESSSLGMAHRVQASRCRTELPAT
jgi:hypothetical protein